MTTLGRAGTARSTSRVRVAASHPVIELGSDLHVSEPGRVRVQ